MHIFLTVYSVQVIRSLFPFSIVLLPRMIVHSFPFKFRLMLGPVVIWPTDCRLLPIFGTNFTCPNCWIIPFEDISRFVLPAVVTYPLNFVELFLIRLVSFFHGLLPLIQWTMVLSPFLCYYIVWRCQKCKFFLSFVLVFSDDIFLHFSIQVFWLRLTSLFYQTLVLHMSKS